MPNTITDRHDRPAPQTMPGSQPATDAASTEIPFVEVTPDALDGVAEAIRRDALHDPLAYVLRSDTQQHGE